MTNLLKIANDNKINIEIKTLDGSYRPLVGHVVNIITFTSATNSTINKQVVITKEETESQIKNKIDEAIKMVTNIDNNSNLYKTEAEMLRAREAFFHNK